MQELVWDGHQGRMDNTSRRAHNFRPIEHRNGPHLAFVDVSQDFEQPSMTCDNVILNASYHVVEKYSNTVGHDGALELIDPHDFELLVEENKMLQTSYVSHDHFFDQDSGVLLEAAFQVVDVDTGKLHFDWRSLDHVSVDETCTAYANPDYL